MTPQDPDKQALRNDLGEFVEPFCAHTEWRRPEDRRDAQRPEAPVDVIGWCPRLNVPLIGGRISEYLACKVTDVEGREVTVSRLP